MGGFIFSYHLEELYTYNTLLNLSEGLYKEKGSKFIGYATPCYNESEAKEFLNTWKKENHQASHLCYAYRFGVTNFATRANDDGEPSNSAGAPILGQIQSFELTNVLIGVVRYFGGTKLGVSGLITAYKLAAKNAIENGIIIKKELETKIEIFFPYEKLPNVMSLLKNVEAQIKTQDFNLDCRLEIQFPKSKEQTIFNNLKNIHLVEIKLL
ncbi:MAG: IMPACT family protein [Crocinitomicaceae bacterium]